MAVTAETIDKINHLDERSTTIVVDLVNFLSSTQTKEHSTNVFHQAREEGMKTPMTEDKADVL